MFILVDLRSARGARYAEVEDVLGVNTLLGLLVLNNELHNLFDHLLDLFLDKRPLSLVMVIFSPLPIVLSSAPTFKIPLESISKVTSI